MADFRSSFWLLLLFSSDARTVCTSERRRSLREVLLLKRKEVEGHGLQEGTDPDRRSAGGVLRHHAAGASRRDRELDHPDAARGRGSGDHVHPHALQVLEERADEKDTGSILRRCSRCPLTFLAKTLPYTT